ncbi:MAG: poly-beta-1,6-N-acetyl-D-glucosamine biosynthesis protein PgaD [Candidatus Muproteobacteria bacterium RBG_19FT_COMBO_61_10]|uniref:Poly-beta-1,6-N-acetyl-D-glucosamine biosynthesis protein PgaD n=1 Tax=Candidatus Muproteobacteria bacterium RBG_19FT_COMBO_61_10 TaxID=1817761 RepID=A0A1F6UP26_9PROT|nr:MAG: poly-beta-1,6-N-acetyl-D-glucosamine biosynthesis protein PgaD [Candidatus Muproteobacteria bacterium RBG_19FT_COMBO_61_10]
MTNQRRRKQPGLQRAAEFTITTLFWLAWLYLIMPLVSLLLWMLGVELFVEVMITRGGYQALLEELVDYSLVILGILAVTVIWVNWNLRHYGGHNKRILQPQPVSIEELAAYSGLSRTEITGMQAARQLLITFDDSDHPVLRTRGVHKKQEPRRGPLRSSLPG